MSTAFGQIDQISLNQSSVEFGTVERSQTSNRTAAEHVLVQYTSDVSRQTLGACSSAAGSLNHFSRLYDLAEAGITTDFTVTSVSVLGIAQSSTSSTLSVSLAKIEGDYTGQNITAGLGPVVNYSFPGLTEVFPDIAITTPFVVEPGKKLAVAVSTRLSSANNRFTGGVFIGNNIELELAPSYIGWPGSGCVSSNNPALLSTAAGESQSMIFHVTGTTEDLGTVELGSKKLAVYPNPASNEVNFSLVDSKVESVEITDVTGKVVQKNNAVKNGKISISGLSAGVYFLRVKDDKGVTRIQKIIKK